MMTSYPNVEERPAPFQQHVPDITAFPPLGRHCWLAMDRHLCGRGVFFPVSLRNCRRSSIAAKSLYQKFRMSLGLLIEAAKSAPHILGCGGSEILGLLRNAASSECLGSLAGALRASSLCHFLFERQCEPNPLV